MFPAAWVVILVIAVLFATAKIMAPVTNAQIMLNILLICFQKATMIYKILVLPAMDLVFTKYVL
jgi:hypothetical protein